MKLFTNLSHFALKCLIAAARTGFNLPVVLVDSSFTEFKSKVPAGKIPVLEVDKQNLLFHPNAIARFIAMKQLGEPLLLSGEDKFRLLEWLEWEESTLTPQLSVYMGYLSGFDGYNDNDVCESKAQTALNLSIIDNHLGQSGRQYLVGDSCSLADIVIFSALFPLLGRNGCAEEELRQSFECVTEYIDRLASEKAFISGIKALDAEDATPFVSAVEAMAEQERHKLALNFKLSEKPKKRVMITTPIYYVNGEPHIGHVYTTIMADALNRWFHVRNIDSFFMTGTDEHGQKVSESANRKNITPKVFCDQVSAMFRKTFDEMNCQYDFFIRTTDESHAVTVKEIWKRLRDAGMIYKGAHAGWYCVSDEAFFTDMQVKDGVDHEGNPCKITIESGGVCEWREEENYMYRLSNHQEKLLEWLRANPDAVVPRSRYNEVVRFIEGGLRDLSVSRAKVSVPWGISVPEDDDHVIYVWLDALNNYLSGSGFPGKEREPDWMWPADYQLMGKDILRFHAIYWPSFLIGSDVAPPKRIVAHGWWTKDKMKIAKRTGNVFDPLDVANQFGLDALRFFLLRESNASYDGDYSESRMIQRLNTDLADSLGNLVCRCYSLKLNPAQSVPVCGELNDDDKVLVSLVNALPGMVDHFVTEFVNFQRALIGVWDVLGEVNKYVTDQQPWVLVKSNPERVGTVLYVMIECVRIVALLIYPVMPGTATKILDQIGVPNEFRFGDENLVVGRLPDGIPFGTNRDVLFQKVDTGKVPKKNPKKKSS